MQRVAIARALVNDPDIILADEPTGALDSESGVQVMELLAEISGEKLVIMVTHNNALAQEYSTRIIDLRDGVVTSDSAPLGEEGFREAARCEEASAEDNGQSESAENTVCAGKDAGTEDGKRRKVAKRRTAKKKAKGGKNGGWNAAMSFTTAASLSFTNLVNKKGRTVLTAFAGSIGIIGIILVLALSGGAQAYIASMEEDVLSQYPIEINRTNSDLNSVLEILMTENEEREEWPQDDDVYINQVVGRLLEHLSSVLNDTNDLAALKKHIEANFSSDIGYVKYDYGVDFDVFCNYIGDDETYLKVDPFTEGIEAALGSYAAILGDYMDMIEQFGDLLTVWDEMLENTELLESQYELVGENSRWPQNYDEVVIVVGADNSLNDYTLFALGLKDPMELIDALIDGDEFASQTYTADELLGLEYRVTTSSDYYYKDDSGKWNMVSDRTEQRQIDFVESNSIPVKVVGVIRPREGTQVASINGNIGYTHALTEFLSDRAAESRVANELTATRHTSAEGETVYYDILGDGSEIDSETYEQKMRELGVADTENPVTIKIYANSLDDKNKIEQFIAEYNAKTSAGVKYSDDLGTMMTYVNSLTDTVVGVLIGFAAISLIVSSIMIAIIIYTSVLERRKEIGVLRSLGARKKDISRVFISESVFIGLVAGVIGVILACVLFMPINLIMQHYLGVANLLQIKWWHAVMMLAISVVLAVIAGFIPSRIAAKKDPVACLHED